MGVTLSLLWRHHFAVLLHQSRKLNQRCRCTVNIIYMDSITTKNISKRGVWLRSIPLVHFNLKKDRFTNEKENIFERKRLFRNFPLISQWERVCETSHWRHTRTQIPTSKRCPSSPNRCCQSTHKNRGILWRHSPNDVPLSSWSCDTEEIVVEACEGVKYSLFYYLRLRNTFVNLK